MQAEPPAPKDPVSGLWVCTPAVWPPADVNVRGRLGSLGPQRFDPLLKGS
jgi:hypothetical protein